MTLPWAWLAGDVLKGKNIKESIMKCGKIRASVKRLQRVCLVIVVGVGVSLHTNMLLSNILRKVPSTRSFFGAVGAQDKQGSFSISLDWLTVDLHRALYIFSLLLLFFASHWFSQGWCLQQRMMLLSLMFKGLRVAHYTSSTSPDTGTITRRCFGMGMGESTCPCGSDSFSLNQQHLSSQADNTRLLNVVVCIVCCFEQMIFICTRVIFVPHMLLHRCRVSCFWLRVLRCLLLAWCLCLFEFHWVHGRRIIYSSVWPVSSLMQRNFALLTVLYKGWDDG